ncbi:SPOR domain-containing protein [Clostridium sp.]|uniref:SPOR domain-containing protein n=1 Tax=Clostridium sp. TaxID=1506 RepID=UPI0028518C11|nr:SPOR domain-containing protein [Clostridium sp.]MDR3593856.1 SPOR domain-containing protein [Clostridium sp.]
MRYTRYEYKKSGKIKFLCSVAIIAGISIGGGLYISNVIFNGKEIQNINKDNLDQSSNIDNSDKIQNIIALQCGYYSKEENAKELLTSISKYCQPFIIEDDGKYRVISGIYTEEDGLKKIEEFKTNNIDVAKINLNLSGDDIDSKKMIEIVDGFLTIINKLQDNQVKSIKTDEFKAWSSKIINDDNQVKTKKLDDLNNYVNSLPEEIDKTNNNTNMQQLYKLIKN